jgi:ABC-type multidrug transport system ATPase subunit
MQIILKNTGRRFNKEWIFRNIDLELSATSSYAVLGANGSGKSTFLQLIAGFLIPSEGNLVYKMNAIEITPEEIYKHVSIASPALELFEDLTLEETINYHFKLKPLMKEIQQNEIVEGLQLRGNEKKMIRNFSSGMKQRVKLGLAIYSDTPVLLLDEPTSNLDKNGIEWYRELIVKFKKERLVLVASNKMEDDYFFCKEEIRIEGYK